jgi:hypothetical protein
MGRDLGHYIMKLVLGVDDHAYTARYEPQSPLSATKKKKRQASMTHAQMAYGQGKTTGVVAKDLEKRYGLMGAFWEMEQDYVMTLIEKSIGQSIEEMVASGERNPLISQDVLDKIETRFKRNLSTRRYDGQLNGVPTLAAQRGVSHLVRHPYAKRAPRPSFIDTGMYQASFKAWLED